MGEEQKQVEKILVSRGNSNTKTSSVCFSLSVSPAVTSSPPSLVKTVYCHATTLDLSCSPFVSHI